MEVLQLWPDVGAAPRRQALRSRTDDRARSSVIPTMPLDSASIAPVTLRVAETFRSLQGEGPSAGAPAHFLRLQGCDVGCRWCDTKYTWDATGGRASTIAEAFAEDRKSTRLNSSHRT